MTDKEKIIKYLDFKGVNKNQFYLKTGLSIGFLDKGSSLGVDKLKIIIDNYHDLNLDWFFYDDGEMIKSENNTQILPLEGDVKVQTEETRPRIPMDAVPGSLSVATDRLIVNNREQLPVIKAFACYDFTIFVRGNSMLPEYHSGDELACLYVENSTFIQWGCYYVLDTVQGIIVKRIYDDDEYILCKSENSDLFKDFRIHKAEVYNIALVIGLVRRY